MALTSKGRILIADDEQTFVEALADLLRREGYECLTVRDGLAAAAELNTTTTPYDLLIADIRMPGNVELELIRHLREIAEGLPVILVTAYPDAPTALKSAELPVLAYLTKPVNFPELLKLVRCGIEHSAVFRANRQIAQRLAAWGGDVKMIEQLLAKGVAGNQFGPVGFIYLSARNLLGCLAELDAMWQRLGPHETSGAAINEALTAAMRVFESTGAAIQQRDTR